LPPLDTIDDDQHLKATLHDDRHLIDEEKDNMASLVKTAKLAGVFVAALALTAPALRAAQPESGVGERQAVVTALSETASATTSWVAESDGWHVVTTVDIVLGRGSDAEQHAVARFSAVLLPGQAELVSVPYALGEQPQVLRIRRLDDRMEVARIPGSSV
jgi:hypothetical protein